MNRTNNGAELTFEEIGTLCSVAALALCNIESNPRVAAEGTGADRISSPSVSRVVVDWTTTARVRLF